MTSMEMTELAAIRGAASVVGVVHAGGEVDPVKACGLPCLSSRSRRPRGVGAVVEAVPCPNAEASRVMGGAVATIVMQPVRPQA